MSGQTKLRLAKLTRPQLHNAVARERLFAKLDRIRHRHKAICVVGPPGAGKTSLVGSWLDARAIKGIWFQADPGDANLATFFHYLGEAAKPFARKGQRPLPALTSEYLHDVAGFSRRFFRELFSRLPAQSMLVLDNYQEVEGQHEFHWLIAQAVNELPLGITLIVISRRDPPDCYARLVANEHVAFIDWEDLRLTLAEAAAIVRLRCAIDDAHIARMHELSSGWAAGLTLLADRLQRGQSLQEADSHGTLDGIFRYFAGELFDRMLLEEQRVLLHSSYLPHMTEAQAVQLTANPNAGEFLDTLYRRHLFVQRRPGQVSNYQFHALFQAFLRHKATQRFTPSEQKSIMLRAAQVLEQSAETEEAFALYLEAHDNEAAKRLLLREAPALIAQGRWKVVMERIGVLPGAMVCRDAWLLYWRGVAQTNIDPMGARADLETAWQAAIEAKDRLCQARACAAVIHAYELEYAQFRPMDPWIGRLQHLLDEQLPFPDADSELRTLGALLIGMMHRKPDDPRLDGYAERMHALLQAIEDANLRLVATTYLLSWGSHTGPIEAAFRARPILIGYLTNKSVSAANASYAWSILSWHYCLLHEREHCLDAIAKAIQIAEDEGLNNAARTIGAVVGSWLEMHAGDFSAAQVWLDKLDALVNPKHPYDRGSSEAIKAWLALMRNEPRAALDHAKCALDCFDDSGCIHHQANYRFPLAWVRILTGDFEEARQWISQERQFSDRVRSLWQEAVLRATEAHIALEKGDRATAEERIAATFRLSRESGYDHVLGHHMRPWMPRLCEVALNAGIENEYVHQLIKKYRWAAPPSRPESWPWPVRIHTLGAFRIEAGGQLLIFSRKTPKKPLALLKAIISFGEKPVASSKLADVLWPDEDGDSAYHSLGLTLHRLRKLLGSPETVELSDGRVSLNEDLVWTDVRSFEQGLECPGSDHRSMEATLRLYGGGFLADAEDAPWAMSARERLRTKFVRHLCDLARHMEQAGQLDAAMAWYLSGIEKDDLPEEFYQGMIRCLAAQGKLAEAHTVYRRLSEMLSASLGIRPSPATRQLMLHLQQ